MTENVINYQIDQYAKRKGKDPHAMNATVRDNIKAEMIQEQYPGK